jgi:hypothetical protein
MKYFLLILLNLLVFSELSFASTWQSISEGKSYKLKQDLKIEGENKALLLSKGTRLRALEVSELNMIKVNFQKYKVQNCPDKTLETELELVPVKVEGKKLSVGINMTKGCILEVFVENKDVEEASFLL